ncbi:AraC family transcriptional regulator [Mitsuokella sp. AF21-1AC]|uniref:helix-turn-helix transcriptional regulator n=1 Tax=Mitsuokella sp. AF21-1AC TaxID=2292235 RepID=UPI000E52FB33|nr:AraC family transcriptional regulator [Mitsuokella sp. AF21-1AC]RGS70989.1 AraC family transcriptional regulator [Mitsuokella sp. AF21-1AC]
MKHDGYNEFRQRGRFDFPIEFHHVDRHHPRFYMPYHWHMEYEIDLVVRGSVTLTLNESQVHAEAGDIIFIRDGVVHGGHPETTDTIYDCIVFDMKKMLAGSHTFQDRIEDVLKHVTLINKYLPASTPDIPRLIQHLFRSMKEEHTGYELVVTGLLYTFFGFIFQQGLYHEAASLPLREHRRKRITQLKQTFQLIDSQYQQPLTLTDLAQAANLSPNYFCRFFQKITHHSPIDYLNRYRIEMACLKLTHTNDSITEIAFSCGFNDVSYFIRLFRRYKETSPRKYKQLMKEGK